MAEYAISIEMEQSFQGKAERFSNAFTFQTEVAETFDDLANINWLKGLLAAVMGNNVSFVTGRSYGIGGPALGNVMREVVDLSGTGAITSSVEVYRECAVLIQFELPRSLILRRRRIGRKWLHVGKLPANGSTTPMATGVDPLSTTLKNIYLANFALPLVENDPPGGGEFASNGDPFGTPTVSDYLEHRQFHRGT